MPCICGKCAEPTKEECEKIIREMVELYGEEWLRELGRLLCEGDEGDNVA
jgi:hypothetical protein